jgi:hypothetical protein
MLPGKRGRRVYLSIDAFLPPTFHSVNSLRWTILDRVRRRVDVPHAPFLRRFPKGGRFVFTFITAPLSGGSLIRVLEGRTRIPQMRKRSGRQDVPEIPSCSARGRYRDRTANLARRASGANATNESGGEAEIAGGVGLRRGAATRSLRSAREAAHSGAARLGA